METEGGRRLLLVETLSVRWGSSAADGRLGLRH